MVGLVVLDGCVGYYSTALVVYKVFYQSIALAYPLNDFTV